MSQSNLHFIKVKLNDEQIHNIAIGEDVQITARRIVEEVNQGNEILNAILDWKDPTLSVKKRGKGRGTVPPHYLPILLTQDFWLTAEETTMIMIRKFRPHGSTTPNVHLLAPFFVQDQILWCRIMVSIMSPM